MANMREIDLMGQAMPQKNASAKVVREEDGYLHFESKKRGKLPPPPPHRKRNENEDHHYSYPNLPDDRGKSSTFMVKDPMKRTSMRRTEEESKRRTPVCSRKGLIIAALVLVCAVAAAVLGTYFFMKNNKGSCDCLSEGPVNDKAIGLTSNTTFENPTTTTTSTTMTTKTTTPVTSSVTKTSSVTTSMPTSTTRKTTTSTKPTTTTTKTTATTTKPTTATTTTPTTTTTTLPTSTISIDIACLQRYRIIPHPTECQAFYNCSLTGKKKNNYPSIYYDECSYPQLFNAATLSCDHFDNVECGARKETKAECEYRSGRCFENCELCGATCSGMKDGRNPSPGAEWTFFFIVCYKERLYHTGICEQDERAMPSLFNPITNDCVTLDRVPHENGGWMPNCTGKAYGTYSNPYAAGSFYFICKDGKYIDYLVCPDGGIFVERLRQCIYP